MRTKRMLVTMCITLVAGTAVSFGVYRDFQPVVLQHVDRGSCPLAVPANAADVNFYYPGGFSPFISLNFTTDESSFRSWSAHLTKRPLIADHGKVHAFFFDPQVDRRVDIGTDNGLLCFWKQEDRGEWFLFDRDTGRAYYQRDLR